MNKPLTLVSMLALILASAFAAYEIVAHAQKERERNALLDGLNAAQTLYTSHHEEFSSESLKKLDLKKLVQECSFQHGIVLMYLTEIQKDAADGSKEQNVSCRATNVSQQKLIRFLAAVESAGRGARVKEVQIKQSPEQSETYQEAEVVIAINWPQPSKRKN